MKRSIPGVRWEAKREKWLIDYYDGHGRRHREYGLRRRSSKSQREVGDALASRRASILADRYDWKARQESPPFCDLLVRLLSSDALSREAVPQTRPRKCEAAQRLLRGQVRGGNHVRRHTGVQNTMSRKDKRPISEAMVDLELNLLKAVFSRAGEAGKAKTNPVKEVKLYRPDNRRSRTLTAAEMGRLFELLAPHVRPVVRVILETGLRVGEVMALRRENVHSKDGGTFLRVERKGGRQQSIPVSEDLTGLLLNVVKSVPRLEGSAAPFWRKPNGQPLKNFRTAWENACKRPMLETCGFMNSGEPWEPWPSRTGPTS